MKKLQLRRYTQLPFLLHLLSTKRIQLLNSNAWDDKNDRNSINQYQTKMELASVYFLCLTSAKETYHHWKVYAGDIAGVSIIFDKDKFEKWAESNSLKSGKVEYLPKAIFQKSPPTLDRVPFVKRFGFRDEKEYRVFQESYGNTEQYIDMSFDLSIIDRIVTNPWMAENVHTSIKKVIQSITQSEKISVIRSILLNTKEWQRAIDNL